MRRGGEQVKLELESSMCCSSVARTSGVKTPDFFALFGTAEAVPSREPCEDIQNLQGLKPNSFGRLYVRAEALTP